MKGHPPVGGWRAKGRCQRPAGIAALWRPCDPVHSQQGTGCFSSVHAPSRTQQFVLVGPEALL